MKKNLSIIDNCQIKKIKIEDVSQVVEIHKVAFKNFFLTSLGDNFLKAYYASCLRDKTTIALGVYEKDDKLIGFASGTYLASGYHKRVFLVGFYSFVRSLFQLILFQPRLLFRLIRNISKQSKVEDSVDYAELLSIAIDPEFTGLGVGKTLLTEFENQVKGYKIGSIALTTDYYNNESVIKFYKSCNYRVYYDFVAYPKRRMYKLTKTLF